MANYSSIQDFLNAMGSASAPAQTSGGASGLSRFFNTPVYSLLYGSQAAQNNASAINNGTYDPTTSFRLDPGYQFAINQGMKAMQQNAAAKGLLESGPLQQQLQTYAQGVADQNYQNYLAQQGSLFGNYQNQLSGLAQFGAGQTGAQQGIDINNLLAQLASSGNIATGQGIAQSNLSSGSDIASLLANQGVLNANAYLNTSAAQSNNILQGNLFTAQLLANLRAGNAQTANSLFSGAGAQAGLNTNLLGNGYSSYTRTGTGGQPGAQPTYNYF